MHHARIAFATNKGAGKERQEMSGLETLLIKARGAARRGDAEAAREIYHEVLERHPANRRARSALAALDRPQGTPAQLRFDALVEAYRDGRMDEAAREGAMLAREFPGVHGVHNLLGAALLALGENAGAEKAFRQALRCDPGAAASANNLAIALRRQHRDDEAEAIYRELIASAPLYAEARYNLANLLEQTAREGEAAQFYGEAIALDPDYVDAYYNLANLHARTGRSADALACFEWAVTLAPDHGDAHNNMGGELLRRGEAQPALAAFERALACPGTPGSPLEGQALVNKGKALVLLGDHAGAASAFRAALARDPTDGSARLQALFEEAHMCDWHARAEYALTQGPEVAAVQPFASLPFRDDPAHQFERSKACAQVLFAHCAAAPALPSPPTARDGRIRLGYFSADFHDHATMYLMSGLFRCHDRARFEVRLYSYGPVRENDASRIELLRHVDAFTEIGAMADEEACSLAHADGLDIALDLKGYTRGTRTRLFGQRLAPVQVGYMGYPGTLGHPCLDYFIADAVSLPPALEPFFCENIVRLPHCYQANDDARTIFPDSKGRAAHGLPEKGFVFASFNHSYKISPREWDIWMRLLGAVEGSVLWLLRSNPWAEANLAREALARGIDPARLVFAPSLPQAEHLGRLALADLFLDTFAVNAHTTASDALWAGLPVLTLAGHQFAARVAASLVSSAGIPELVVESEGDYEALALSLVHHPQALAALRARLRTERHTCPLFDTQKYTADFETALETMHRRRAEGLAPTGFDIT